jgi:hypothetical protein
MKVFLSWSGDTSHKVAMILREWLPSVIQSIEPYVSSEDIDKGARWSTDIASELQDSTYGILCVTKENLHAPWLMFEAGALSKTMDKSYVCPFLFDIKRAEVNGPALQFQSTIFEKEDIKKLLLSLNQACSQGQLTFEQLEKAFGVWFPSLEDQLNTLLQSSPSTETKEKHKEITTHSSEILEEILDISRINQKLLRNPDSDVSKEVNSIRIMLSEIVERSEFNKESRMAKRKRKIHPMIIEELFHMPRFEKNLTGFQIAISLFRNDFPWIYDAGLDVVKTLKNVSSQEDKRDAIEAFQELIEFTFEHPMMREMYMPDKEMWMMGKELPHMLKRSLERQL